MTAKTHEALVNTGLGVISTIGLVSDLVSHSPYREILPDIYQEHAGNFGIPWCLEVIINLVGHTLELQGKNTDNQKMVSLGLGIRNYGNAFILGLLFGVEGQFINHIALLRENAGDLSMGLIAILIGANIGTKIADSFLSNKKI